jgi:preprotein translocase subunit SecY
VVLLKNFRNMFRIPELTQRLLFTLGVLIIFRLGAYIPVAGVNITRLADFMTRQTGGVAGLLKYLDIFSGGQMAQCTLFALGISPYITASIIMQVLSMGGVQYLEQLSKEGEYGRKQINQYTRYLTLLLAVVYSFGLLTFLETYSLVLDPGFAFRAFFVLSVATGAMVVMWLGEQISLRGLGSGSSVLMFAGIVAMLPTDIAQTIKAVYIGNLSTFVALVVWAVFLIVAGLIIFLEKGERKIPVQYARRVIGQKVYGGQSTYIPFKINPVGVMPAIFASSALRIPTFIAGAFSTKFPWLRHFVDAMNMNGYLFNILTFGLIVFFSYAYTAMVFKPADLADNMKKSGGFIPGIRPGKTTADYFDYILVRIGLVGSIYLGMLVLMPNIMQALIALPFHLGGTSLLILIGVALELSAQMESYLIEHRYGSFLTAGRIKNRVRS